MSYYIETSQGKIYFDSQDINNMKIKNDCYEKYNFMYKYTNCQSVDDSLPKIINKLYYQSWTKIHTIHNDHGLFLIADDFSVSGTHYVEYKIYKSD
jgi:hypothetical protein